VLARSHCPKCGTQLKAWENIPLFSFLALRGRCRNCRTPISWQYPAVELITGLLFAAVVWRFGFTPQALAGLAFTAFLVAMSGIDLRTTLLPDDLTLPLMWGGLLLSLVPLFVAPADAILGAALGYLSLWSVYWAFKLLTGKEGMGYGDFKLLAAIGAWLGAWSILPVLLLSSLVGAVLGSAWLLLRGRDRATPIPFGPYLAVAGWIQLMWGPELLRAWFRYSGM
jgi:leader peptidase (prepilin peptidase)/N-methyltransferase